MEGTHGRKAELTREPLVPAHSPRAHSGRCRLPQSPARRGLCVQGAFAISQCVHAAPDVLLLFQHSGAAYVCFCRVSSPLPLTRAQCPHEAEVVSSPVFPRYPATAALVLSVDAPVLDNLNKCSHTAVLPCACFLRSESVFRGRVVTCVGTPPLS